MVAESGLVGRPQADLVGLGLTMVADADAMSEVPGHEIQVEEVLLHGAVVDGRLRVRRGELPTASIRVVGPIPSWGAVLAGAMSLSEAVRRGALGAQGSERDCENLSRLYSGGAAGSPIG